jgi:hypothetical protein
MDQPHWENVQWQLTALENAITERARHKRLQRLERSWRNALAAAAG